MYQLWADHGRAAPIAMAADSMDFAPDAAPDPPVTLLAPRLTARPNPFRARIELRLDLPRAAAAVFELVDTQGRIVLRRESSSSANHRMLWDGHDASGRPVASGVYWARVSTGTSVLHQRVMHIR